MLLNAHGTLMLAENAVLAVQLGAAVLDANVHQNQKVATFRTYSQRPSAARVHSISTEWDHIARSSNIDRPNDVHRRNNNEEQNRICITNHRIKPNNENLNRI